MMKRRRSMAVLLAALMTAALLAGCSSSGSSQADSNYPEEDISAIVPWGEGGGTDSLSRPLAALAAEYLGQSIEVGNMPGNTGADGMQAVYDADADGYTLLMSAENPPLYEALGLSDLSYDNFTCIFLVGDEKTGVVVAPDSPYETLTDLVEAALSGTTVTLATTGTGGLPWEVGAMITAVTGAEFEQVDSYDGDAAAKQAVLDGECDFTVCRVQTAYEEYEFDQLRWLCVFDTEPVGLMTDVPVITDEYPGFEEYLPWGPFVGVFVKEGTDEAVVEKLTDAFAYAYNEENYQDVLESYYVNPLGYTGEEAEQYIQDWGDNTIEALTKAGSIAE